MIARVLVVIPAYNEERSLLTVLGEVRKSGYDFVVIDDGSSDKTSEAAVAAGAKVVRLPINLGVGGALRTGFQFARRHGYEAAVQIDADGQHDPSYIRNLVDAANTTTAHLIVGSRFRSSATSMTVGKVRRQVMKIMAKSASIAAKTEITDATSGFRLIREPLLTELSVSLPTNYLGDTYEAIVAAGRAGYIVHEIPAPIRERMTGMSSSTTVQSVKFTFKALGVWVLRLHARIKPLGHGIDDSAW